MKLKKKHFFIIAIISLIFILILIYCASNICKNAYLESIVISEYDIDYDNFVFINIKLNTTSNIKNESFICTNGNLELYVNNINITKVRENNNTLEVNIQLYCDNNQRLIEYLSNKDCFLEFDSNDLFKNKTLIKIPFDSDV